MSSAVVSTSAALGRPFVFDEVTPEVCPSSAAHKKPAMQESAVDRVVQSTLSNQKSKILASVTPASQLNIRPAPEMASSGISAIDTLTGGLPRGCLTEICGPASSGRTSMLLSALAAATRRGEFCALVDASDALDPQSAAAAGVELERLLWVRCGDDTAPKSSPRKSSPTQNGCPISRASSAREMGEWEVKKYSQVAFDFEPAQSKENSRQSDHCLEQVLRATDLLLESGGFGLIVLDLGDLPPQSARRIPLTTWFRFRRAVENKPTVLLALEQQPIAGSCSSLLLKLGSPDESAAERRQIAAHSLPRTSRGGVSRGSVVGNGQAPEGRKKICDGESTAAHQYIHPYAHQPIHPSHTHLLTGLNINAELRSRLDRKPARSVGFATKTAWAG